MLSGKYFDLTSDNRFPLNLDNSIWIPLNDTRSCKTTGNLSIYVVSGYGAMYIGFDSRDSRGAEHRKELARDTHCNQYLQNVYNTHGISGFYYTKVLNIPEEYKEYRHSIENSYIKHFDTYNNGYNLVEFADAIMLGRKFTKEHIEKRLETLILNNVRPTQEQKDRISKIKTNPFYILSPAGKLIYVEAMQNFCKENNLFGTGIRKLKIGSTKSYKGWRLPKENRDYSLEEIREFMEAEKIEKRFNKKKEYWFYKDGEVIKIKNLPYFSKQNGLNYGSMNFAYNGTNRYKSHKGYTSAKQLQLEFQATKTSHQDAQRKF